MEQTIATSTGKPAIIFDVKELRIGNILIWKTKLVYVTSLSLDIDDEYEEQLNFCYLDKNTDEMGGWVRNICADLKPVPLTPEISQGFDFAENFKVKVDKEGVWVEQFGEGLEKLEHVKYVHQLQNLYHSLMGKELILPIISGGTNLSDIGRI